MSASARGTIDDPGRNVKAKSGLNKSILDQGWFKFRRQLGYKLDWQGGTLVEVDYRHTSQRCSCCGHTSKQNRPSQAVFRCQVCGFNENANVNAARNILTAGLADMGYGSNCNSNRKQQPAGTREEVLSKSSYLALILKAVTVMSSSFCLLVNLISDFSANRKRLCMSGG